MKNIQWDRPETDALIQALLALRNENEAKMFLRDLLTEAELVECGNRWKVVQLLEQKVPYVAIEQQIGMSSTTIARIQKWLLAGTGGYQLLLNRLHHTSRQKKRLA